MIQEEIALIRSGCSPLSVDKSYTDKHRREFGFVVDNLVNLKVSLIRSMYVFATKKRLYIYIYVLALNVSPLCNRSWCLLVLEDIHDISRISQLRVCLQTFTCDALLCIQWKLTYEDVQSGRVASDVERKGETEDCNLWPRDLAIYSQKQFLGHFDLCCGWIESGRRGEKWKKREKGNKMI
jgi:hypothetical protein